jgi:hypothetical protein
MVLASLYEFGEALYKDKMYDETIAFAHVYQYMDLEVQIDLNYNLVNAVRNDKKGGMTLIPSTIEGEARSNAKDLPSPFGLHDNLIHIAGDYSVHFSIDNSKHFNTYINKLTDWCSSGTANEFIFCILEYLKRNNLIQDMRFFINDIGLKYKVRFSVIDCDGTVYKPWLDRSLINSYADYYHDLLSNIVSGESFCYITGKKEGVIRNGLHCFIPDMIFAKLFSKDEDKMLLTYKGRLKSADEVAWIGNNTTLVINYALRWLIKNRSVRIGDIFHIFFDIKLRLDWHILNSTHTLMKKNDIEENRYDLLEASIIKNIGRGNRLIYFGLSAITMGRLNIHDFRQYNSAEINLVIKNIVNHHYKYQWRFSNGYYCLPEAKIIAFTLLNIGPSNEKSICSENLIKELMKTHIFATLEDRPIPINYVNKAVYNAIYSFKDDKENISWREKFIAVCAIIRGNLNMNDEEKLQQLYEEDYQIIAGRLLAILHWVDYKLYRHSFRKRHGEERLKEACNVWQYESMARKSMKDFVIRPYKAWCYLNMRQDDIENRLKQLDVKVQYFINLRARLESILFQNGFSNMVNLDGRALLGYEMQIYDFLNIRKENNFTEENNYEYQE